MLTIAVLGTLDTKGSEHAFVADCIRNAGHQALLIDVGTHVPPSVVPEWTREQVLEAEPAFASGAHSPLEANEELDRGQAIARMAKAVPHFVKRLVDQGKIDGIIALGGSGGTSIATAAMRGLPLGFPKVMVSTVAGGDVSAYVDISDIVMLPSIVDVSGINRISVAVFTRAAAVVIALATANQAMGRPVPSNARPLIAASMFGNTTHCVQHATKLLDAAGYETLVFHATGNGGRTMESLIAAGWVSGVLDVTTTEWADELVGGVMPGGPHRLEAAARGGVPAVIAPGCLDMVNFRARETVPERFAKRRFYQHNAQVTLMRTSPEECTELGKIIASKLNLSTGPVCVLYPLQAISVISAQGQPFYEPAADKALLDSLRQSLRSDIPLEAIDCEINAEIFAERCVSALLELIRK